MATTTCIHGFGPGQCLICQTLQSSPRPDDQDSRKSRRRQRVTSPPPSGSVSTRPAAVRPDAVMPAGSSGGGSLGLRALGIVVVVILLVLAGFWIAGVVFAILRLIEVVAAALVAGWIGYRIGLFRGRRMGPRA